MKGSPRGTGVILLVAGAALAGAQISLAPGASSDQVSPADAAAKTKVLKGLEGVKWNPEIQLYTTGSRGGGVLLFAGPGRNQAEITERPAHPTEAELIARSERILARLGYRKGIDFDFEWARSWRDPEESRDLGPTLRVGGERIQFRRPAFRGFFDLDQTYVFEYDLVADELVSLSLPPELGTPSRVSLTKAITVEEAAARAATAIAEYQRETRAFWARQADSPSALLKSVDPVWQRQGVLDDPHFRPGGVGLPSIEPIPNAERDILIPTYSFRFGDSSVTVRADTGEVRIPYYGGGGMISILGQMNVIGREAPQLSEFLVVSSLAFWILAPLTLAKVLSQRRASRPEESCPEGGQRDA
jgi:hypothetical protein